MPNLLYYYSSKTAPITKVLSQYELLQAVCSTLSSADIVHLAATCTFPTSKRVNWSMLIFASGKEHRTHITSSKEILALLQSNAHCDGRGIVAQARVFGYWKGDPTQAPEKSRCLGADARPCITGGAHVCDVSFYLDSLLKIMKH